MDKIVFVLHYGEISHQESYNTLKRNIPNILYIILTGNVGILHK